MKLSAVLALASLVLGVCLASPLDKNELHVSSGRDSELGRYEEYGCDKEHTSSVWGPYIPHELQEKTKDTKWQYNKKHLGHITDHYWELLREKKAPGRRANGLPPPQDKQFDVITISGGGQYSKMVNAKTHYLASLRNKSLDIDFESESALLSMATKNESIILKGQLMGDHDSEGGSAGYECEFELKPDVRFQLLMDMKKDKEGHYRVSMNQCKFNFVGLDEIKTKCEKAKDGKDLQIQLLNSMAQLVCQQAYFEEVKDDVENHIRVWNPYKRAEVWAKTEIYKLMEKFANEKLKTDSDIEVDYNCVFEKQGYKVHFEHVKIHGQDGFEFHPMVPSAYILGHHHHVDTMLMMYRPLTADYTVRIESASENRTVSHKAVLISPVKIGLHYSTEMPDGVSFTLRYHPDVMLGGISSVSTTDHSGVHLMNIFHPLTVNVFIAHVQRELFDFLYPGALGVRSHV